VPVVATPDVGAVDVVTDDATGLLVPHRDPVAVARALNRLLANPALRRRLGANLRRQVEREWSAAAVVPLWERLFDEVIGERGGG
jgi:glycosyltransferase involved in cell wall biosynthesis